MLPWRNLNLVNYLLDSLYAQALLVHNSKKQMIKFIKRLFAVYKNQFLIKTLKIVGTGFKCVVPKRSNYNKLLLRVGFAGAELAYTNITSLLKNKST
jgi:hypothetical protein